MQSNHPTEPAQQRSTIKRISWLVPLGAALITLIAVYLFFLQLSIDASRGSESGARFSVYCLIVIIGLSAAIPVMLVLFRRTKWAAPLLTWNMARATVLFLALTATGIAVFYTAENWRGRQAWEDCTRELDAKGETADWSAFVPPPVPDVQNIIKAPNMSAWFVRVPPIRGGTLSNELTRRLTFDDLTIPGTKDSDTRSNILLANLITIPGDLKSANDFDAIVSLAAPDAARQLSLALHQIVGESLEGPQRFTFCAKPLDQIKPGRIALRTDATLSGSDLTNLLNEATKMPGVGGLQLIANAKPDAFQIVLNRPSLISAEHYLNVSDRAAPEFNQIRTALARPFMRMDGGYERPFEIAIVNFVTIRTVAQIAAQRAQCCLLLGKSEQALHELSLVMELRGLLKGNPKLLVSAMIDVAIMGMYTDVISDGLRLHAWQEPELKSLQAELRKINLPPVVADAFRTERAAVCRTIEATSASEWADIWSYNDPQAGLWKKFTNPMFLFFALAPRGWLYQNMVTIAPLEQLAIEAFDSSNKIIQPKMSALAYAEILKAVGRRSPYAVIAPITLPNFDRATRTLARNQTKVNQAYIACALERYHLAYHTFPETLSALRPEFAQALPLDVIGGQPLHYVRTDSDQFLLYSVGWNETDDGGTPVSSKVGAAEETSSDWVWSQK